MRETSYSTNRDENEKEEKSADDVYTLSNDETRGNSARIVNDDVCAGGIYDVERKMQIEWNPRASTLAWNLSPRSLSLCVGAAMNGDKKKGCVYARDTERRETCIFDTVREAEAAGGGDDEYVNFYYFLLD